MNKYKLMSKMIEYSVPILNIFRPTSLWPYTLPQLEYMESGSLGNNLHEFLNNRNLDFLKNYETHDAYHALLGYGTTVTEELKLQAFMWGNGNSTYAGRALLIFGLIIFPSKYQTLVIELKKVKSAKPLKLHDVISMLPKQITLLRKELCIK